MELLTALAIGLLFAFGLYQFLRRNLIRSAIGLIILSNAINLFLLSTGAYRGLVPAYVGDPLQHSDALPQALVLTAVVISMGGFAFITAMLSGIVHRYRSGDSDDVSQLKG